jgi:hypothetical protein
MRQAPDEPDNQGDECSQQHQWQAKNQDEPQGTGKSRDFSAHRRGRIAVKAARKYRHIPAAFGTFIEANISTEGGRVTSYLALVLDQNVSAENIGVTLNLAADVHIATKTSYFCDFLIGSHRDVMAELRAFVEASSKCRTTQAGK